MKRQALVAAGAIAGLIVLFAAWGSFYTVNTGYRGVVTEFGKIVPGVAEPGIHLKLPFIEGVARIDNHVQAYKARESAGSLNNIPVTTRVTVNYQIVAKDADKIYANYGSLKTLETRVIAPSVSDAIKTVTAKYDIHDLTTKRPIVMQKFKDAIKDELSPFDINVVSVHITNLSFSRELVHAIENKQKAKQASLAAQYDLRRAKIDNQQKVVVAKAQAQARVVAAKADAQSRVIQAEGQAKAILAKAKAETKAMAMKKAVLNRQLLALEEIDRWNGKVSKTMVGGGMMPFLNITPASGSSASVPMRRKP